MIIALEYLTEKGKLKPLQVCPEGVLKTRVPKISNLHFFG